MVKKKNKRLLRRLCSFVGVLIVVCCMMLPASAADTGSTSSDEKLALLPFDRLVLRRNGSSEMLSLPWAASHFFSDSDVANSSIWIEGPYDYSMTGVSVSSGIYSLLMKPSWVLSDFRLSLECDNFYVSLAKLNSGSSTVTFTNSVTATCTITFRINIIESDGTSYSANYYSLDATSSGSSFDLAAMIYRAIQASNYDDYEWYNITDLQVLFTGISGDGDIGISTSVVNVGQNVVRRWFDAFGVTSVIYEPADPGDINMTWLVGSVSETLGIELWPGFTIGGLLRVCFVIGLLFWFLKLTI